MLQSIENKLKSYQEINKPALFFPGGGALERMINQLTTWCSIAVSRNSRN